jgi:hypothetical protein
MAKKPPVNIMFFGIVKVEAVLRAFQHFAVNFSVVSPAVNPMAILKSGQKLPESAKKYPKLRQPAKNPDFVKNYTYKLTCFSE